MSRQIVRKSDIGAPPARMSAGAPPSLPVRRSSKGFFRRHKSSTTPNRKKRPEENLDLEESDETDQTSVADDQDDNESSIDLKKEDEAEEKIKKPPRKKRRFRLTDSTAKSRRRAERRAQLAAERKEREEMKQEMGDENEDEKERSPTPQPAPKAASIDTYSHFQLFCDHILRKMQAKDPDDYFAYPVTQSMAPDYHEVIKEPMDFSTMRQKIENDEYMEITALRRDAELIVKNALDYNLPGSIYYVAAQKLDLIVQFYFSEQHLRYLFYSLPFAKDIPLEKIGLPRYSRPRPLPKTDYKSMILDDVTPSAILDSVDQSLRQRLSSRVPDLKKILPDDTNGVEPKCHLAFLDNKDGAVCLNLINPTMPCNKTLTLGDIVEKLAEGTPGLCAPQEHKSNSQVPISYLSYGPFCSFAPQYDSTWATLCERDSRLLLSTYGDKQNATNAVSMRKMVEDAGEHMIKVVDDLLDTLTDGEHRRTIAALESDPENVDPADENLEKLLGDIETLENIGIDVSFVTDVRKLYDLTPEPYTTQEQLDKTGAMISDLALLQKNRLSSLPPATLTDQPSPGKLELNLASRVQEQLQNHIGQFAKPGNVISSPVIHSAVGLNEEDLDLLNEFFTAPPASAAV